MSTHVPGKWREDSEWAPSLAVARRPGESYDLVVSQPLSDPPPGFDLLSVEQKLQYIRVLWARTVTDHGDDVLSPAQERELQRRVETYHEDPSVARPWADVRAELWKKHGSRGE